MTGDGPKNKRPENVRMICKLSKKYLDNFIARIEKNTIATWSDDTEKFIFKLHGGSHVGRYAYVYVTFDNLLYWAVTLPKWVTDDVILKSSDFTNRLRIKKPKTKLEDKPDGCERCKISDKLILFRGEFLCEKCLLGDNTPEHDSAELQARKNSGYYQYKTGIDWEIF